MVVMCGLQGTKCAGKEESRHVELHFSCQYHGEHLPTYIEQYKMIHENIEGNGIQIIQYILCPRAQCTWPSTGGSARELRLVHIAALEQRSNQI